MDKPDRNDQQINELFAASRRVDRETLPGYRSVRDAERPADRRAPGRRILILSLATATASVALAAVAFMLVSEANLSPETNSTIVREYVPPPTQSARSVEAPIEIAQATGPERTEVTDERSKSRKPDPSATLVTPTPVDVVVGDKTAEVTPRQSPKNLENLARLVREMQEQPQLDAQKTVQAEKLILDLQAEGRIGNSRQALAELNSTDVDGQESLHGSRSRDFKSVVGGVSNVDPFVKGLVAVNSPQRVSSFSYAQAVGQQLEFQFEEEGSTESYDMVEEQGFVTTRDEALSTFSIDVDTASYSNIRRYLSLGKLPPRDAVRIEEMINYFDYDYPEPSRGEPFSTHVEVAGCPWNPTHRLARIGIKGRDGGREDSRGSNLVFLIDVSGSMRQPNKLPLLKSSFAMLVDQLGARDQVAIVVYAGASGLVLPSTSGADRAEILGAITRLEAGGSTNGGAGLELAYRIARENLIPGGVNRVVLATDGDFNVGRTSGGELLNMIKADASAGISLTALGFGMGNLKDATLELLADKGDGNYFYIDSEREARKVLVEELQGTLVTIAKDVKIQVEFNPAEVEAYRLIGYENRALAKQDFNDDKKDAGEIGSGHTVTALYEIVPAGTGESRESVDPLKYQRANDLSREAGNGELFTLKVRYKEPEETESRLLQFASTDSGRSFQNASGDFRFAATVAAFGMVLRESEHRGTVDLDGVAGMLAQGVGLDKGGYRAEFQTLVQQARVIPRR